MWPWRSSVRLRSSTPLLFKLNIGVSSSGKTQHFDCCIRRFESCHPSQKKASRKTCFFQLYSPCGEFYCFAVIFGLRRVVFASRVYEANIISLRNEVEQYHCCLRQYHADKVSISLKTFRLKVFQNFVDAFPRGALLAHLFASVDRFEPAKH